MVLDTYSIQETHYDILSVKQDASYEDIRASYRSAILNSHPDKSQNTSGSGDRFLKVQKAWEILGDSRARALYDIALRASRHDAIVAEDISLEDVMAEDAGEVIQLYYQCRCGDYFFVDSLELEKMGYALLRDGSKISFEAQNALPASLVLPCGSCSLKVRILINSDHFVSIDDHH
ncbi:PREDICTED: DPH4 homolog [Prunus mume]|uniref:DPH4 homolog n=1 Tax=Prunus mume TaxID=102107 RepID=A0ABM0N6C8_PRUMU|nr:PREDICTED: DPH4 homolog [Prunus mume]